MTELKTVTPGTPLHDQLMEMASRALEAAKLPPERCPDKDLLTIDDVTAELTEPRDKKREPTLGNVVVEASCPGVRDRSGLVTACAGCKVYRERHN